MGSMSSIVTLPPETLEQKLTEIKSAENSLELLGHTWRVLFDVDLSDPSLDEGEVKPWDFGISEKLAGELMEFSRENFKEEHETISFIWLNWSPTMKKELNRDQISFKEVLQ